MSQRIGIFGGSFDPIHLGHLLLAESCREALHLDAVHFLVAHVSPFKTDQHPTEAKHRLEMLALAIGAHPSFFIDRREIERSGTSYTVDSLREIRQERSSDELFLLMGADALADIAKWKDPSGLFQLARPAIVSRGGFGDPPWERLAPWVSPSELEWAKQHRIVAPQMEISSRDIRQRVRTGESIRYQVTPAVEIYIREHHLYRDA